MSAPKNKGKGRSIPWLKAHVDYSGDECLTWPFGCCHGYGQFSHLGRVYSAHRYMCELVNGPSPTPEHEASHSCGRGHLACVDPRHLSWKTPSENQYDRVAHGRNYGRRGKLTPADGEAIRALRGIKSQPEIAAMFGTSRANISLIQNGKAHVRPKRPGRGYSVRDGKFVARITINKRQIWLGTFDTEEAARAAFLEADNQARLVRM